MRGTPHIRALLLAAATWLVLLGAPAVAGAVTISGTAMKDELGTTWQGCAGGTNNVSIAINGAYAASTSCDPATGAFTFTGITIPAIGAQIAIWYDTPLAKGALYTTAASTVANIAGLTPTQDRVWVRSEQGATTLDATLLTSWDSVNDADVPVIDSGTYVTLAADTELHIDSPIEFAPNMSVTATNIHVETGATYTGADWAGNETFVQGNGTQTCDKGPNIARPLCIEAGGTWSTNNAILVYEGPTGTYTIEPIVAREIRVQGAVGSTGVIGYAPGQTLTTTGWFDVRSRITSDPWATDIVAESISIDPDAAFGGFNTQVRWTGDADFNITVDTEFTGGEVDLPGARVTVNASTGRSDIGPTDAFDLEGRALAPDWSIYSLTVRNGTYQRSAYGVGATGMTAPVDVAAGTDHVVDVVETWAGMWEIVQLSQNGGDWGIVRYNDDGTPDMDWDDGDLNGIDNDGNAILTFNSGVANVDVPWAASAMNGDIVVVGSSNANWMIRKYDGNGMLDAGFGTGGVVTWNPGAADEARGVEWENGRIAVAGTATVAALPGWRVRLYDETTGAFLSGFQWAPAAGAEVRGMCFSSETTQLYVVGRTGAAGTRDWAARRIAWDWSGWNNFGAVAAYTWDAGGTEDEAIACSVGGSSNVYITGTTGTGALDDGRIRAFTQDGYALDGTAQRPVYGTAGVVSFGTAPVDDEVFDIAADPVADSVVIAGRDPGNGGQAILRRFDPDGDADESWGTNGVITWDGGVGTDESARALVYHNSSDLHVGVRVGTNNGDAALRRYDFAGDLTTAAANGTTRVLARNAWRETSRITVLDTTTVGTNTRAALLDLESYDIGLETRNVVNVQSQGMLRASSTRPLTSRNDIYLLGSFWANLGEVRIDTQTYRAELQYANGTRLYRLTVDSPGTMFELEGNAGKTLYIDNLMSIRGGSCASPIQMTTPSAAAYQVDTSGGGAIVLDYVNVAWLNAVSGGAIATNYRNLGNNTNVTWSGGACAGAFTLPPNGFKINDVFRPRNVDTMTPFNLGWYTRLPNAVDKADAEIWSSPTTGQVALWRLDGSTADSASGTWPLSPNTPAVWSAARFGQGASINGTHDGYQIGDLDLPGNFTIDGWVNTTLATADAWPDLIYKGDGAGANVNYALTFDNAGNLFRAAVATGGVENIAAIPESVVADGAWHHVAMVYRDGGVKLYVDGTLRATGDTPGVLPAQNNFAAHMGYRMGGTMDEWRVMNVASTADEIRGYFQTGRQHAEKIWDFDPTDVNGTAINFCGATAPGTAPPCAAHARVGITYTGGASLLSADRARYWVRARTKEQASGTWSGWSDYDFFDTSPSITASITTGPTVQIGSGSVLPGADSVGTATWQVTTNHMRGYSTWVQGPSSSWGLSDGIAGAAHELPGRGAAGTPTAWPAGTSGFFGLSVLSATGGKDTGRWGTGTIATDYANLNWGWGSPTTPLLLHTRTAFDSSAQQLQLALRANASTSNDPGRYTTTLVLTAVPNV